ncbi:glycosyltransferase family 9 protein [Actinomycetospora sp. OC33-EN08]|uniref:Glycosyltransferase family 9 protein n=1 Tax=Actinomycetospora aurantiaca TaxID=3129233 RepID=A0ABU8MXF0_9PSEU
MSAVVTSPVAGPALGVPADPAPLVPDVRRLAILRANGLGDLVVAEPALAAVRAAYPDAEITLLGQPHHEALLAGRPSPVDRVVTVPPVPGVRVGPGPDAPAEVVEAWAARQRAHGYDLAIQMHGGGGNSNPLVARLGARVTAGTAAPGAPRLDRWVPYTPYQHDTLRWNELAAAVGARTPRIEPRIAVTEADLAASRAVVPETDDPLVVVHPGATDARRCYPEERLGAVAAGLEGARVVVVGGASESDRVAAVARGYAAVRGHEPETTVGGLGLPGLVGLLARSRLMIGNDSGPRHVAGAVGTPTVAVFTYANLADVAPLTRVWHRVLVSWHGGCRVCGRRVLEGWCGHQESATHDVPVADVHEAAQDLWEQTSP